MRQIGVPRWCRRVVARSSPSGWLVCTHSWVEWLPRAGYPLDDAGCATMRLSHRGAPLQMRARRRRTRNSAENQKSHWVPACAGTTAIGVLRTRIGTTAIGVLRTRVRGDDTGELLQISN